MKRPRKNPLPGHILKKTQGENPLKTQGKKLNHSREKLKVSAHERRFEIMSKGKACIERPAVPPAMANSAPKNNNSLEFVFPGSM